MIIYDSGRITLGAKDRTPEIKATEGLADFH